jgi:FdhE protein
MRPTFEERILRARELAEAQAFAAEVLRFYVEVARFQKALYEQLARSDAMHRSGELHRAARASKRTGLEPPEDLEFLASQLPSLLAVVEQAAPKKLAAAARDLSQRTTSEWKQALESFWSLRESPEEAESFFLKAVVQPWAELSADHAKVPRDRQRQQVCPVCESKPVAGILRPEGHGAKRSLLCSLCSTEWAFPRVACPGCGGGAFGDLPVYTAAGFDYVRVEACDRCKVYVKCVDMTKNGLAVPVVDELAAVPLDLWAQENGYVKLERNLMEF